MALRSPKRECIESLSVFEDVAQEIHTFFEIFSRTLMERRDQLLEQLDSIKLEYLKKEESRKSHEDELEKMLRRMSGITTHENLVASLKFEQLENIRKELEGFQQATPVPVPVFRVEDIKPHLMQLMEIGKVESSCVYSTKEKPVSSIGKGELDRPFGVCLDQDETLYVCDCGNSRVQVISKEGEFLSEVGKGELVRPYGIAVDKEWVFVVDWELNAVFKFQKSDHKLVKKGVGIGLHNPKDLALDKDSKLLITDCHNNRIAVLNTELEMVGEMGKGKLKYPCGIKINMNKIFVTDYGKPNNVHVFSHTGDLLHSMINIKLNTSLMSKNFGRHRIFLCLDQFGNIIVSATDDKSIQIFTMEGNLLHSIKCEGCPTGIAVNNDDVIVCAMYEPSSIKFY